MGKYIYYTNGKNEKKIYPGDEIPEGWRKGRLKDCATTKGYKWINNGIDTKFISKTDPIPEGWVRGRLNNNINSTLRSNTYKLLKYRHYTDGIRDILIANNELIPEGFYPGRPTPSFESRLKMSNSHIGIHHTQKTKDKISQHSNNNRKKAFQTILDNYGNFETYYKLLLDKANITKYKNGTFNSSKVEDNFYRGLCEEFGRLNIYRGYKCDRYPYRCDFYILPLDKFIEINAHWTHGFKPYVESDPFCIELLKLWEEKAKTSRFYRNAIQTWTVRDVEKLRVAKENNLNYEVIY